MLRTWNILVFAILKQDAARHHSRGNSSSSPLQVARADPPLREFEVLSCHVPSKPFYFQKTLQKQLVFEKARTKKSISADEKGSVSPRPSAVVSPSRNCLAEH